MKEDEISPGLQSWFLVHFVIDIFLGIPLLIIPESLFSLFGYESVNLVFGRLVGAALIAIGVTSLLMNKNGKSAYVPLLQLKLLWSGSAIIAFVLSLIEHGNIIEFLFLGIFLFFFAVWAFYLLQFHKNK